MNAPLPFVSLVVVNYNGMAHLPDCLRSVAGLDYPSDHLQILLIDNGSTDGSTAWVRERYPQVEVMELERNYGFAEGNNRGASAAQGEILVFLNTDTRVDPAWLRALVTPFTEGDSSLAATASKMLDWEGGALDFPVYATLLGMPHASREERAYRRPGDYDTAHYLLFASGGAMAIRREAFFEVGGFDPDYFMYHEDVDLGWRLWLNGFKLLYVPSSVVYHKSGGSSSGDAPMHYFLNERNALFTVFKNAGDAWLNRLLPLLLLWMFERIGLYLGVDPSAYQLREARDIPASWTVSRGTLAGVAAVMDFVRHLPELLEKRAAIQARRVRTDEEIAALLDLPREVFVQMMLGARIDFTRVVGLLDSFGLGLSDTSLLGGHVRRLGEVAASQESDGRQLLDCFLYLGDHTPEEAEARYGRDILSRLAAHLGLEPRDLSLLARVLAVVGSKALAGLLTGAAAPSAPAGRDAPNFVNLLREAVWRDAVFFREELAKRTDQLIQALREQKTQAAQWLAREAAVAVERERLGAELVAARQAQEGTEAELSAARRAQEEAKAELAERERLIAQLRLEGETKENLVIAKDAALVEGEADLRGLREELMAIQESLGYRLVEAYRRRVFRIAPPGTRRASLHGGVLRGVRWLLDFRLRVRSLGLWARPRGPLTLLRQTIGVLRQEGWRGLRMKVGEKLRPDGSLRSVPAGVHQWTAEIQPLTFPAASSPKVSIVIPVYGKAVFVYNTLKAVLDNSADVPYEVIVVDDASPDETEDMLRQIGNIKVIRNAQNFGFLEACHVGGAAARGEYVLLLNSDTRVRPGWLRYLTQTVERDPAAGVVGAKLIYPDGSLQEAGSIIWSDGFGWNYGRFDDPARPEYNFVREVDYCSGACIMLRRDLWQAVGGFDLRYAPAYYEDTDLAFTVRALGYKVLYQPKAEVVHFEGVSHGTDPATGTKRFQELNRQKFVEKWKDVLAKEHWAHGTELFAARQRGRGKRILVADHHVPTFDRDSGSQRMFHILQLLMGLGHTVVFLPHNMARMEPYTEELQQTGIEVLYGPMDVPTHLARIGSYLDLVWVARPDVGRELLPLLRRAAPQARFVYDTVDLHFLRESRRAALERSRALQKNAEEYKARELAMARACDATIVVSAVEREFLLAEDPSLRVHVIPNVHEVHGNAVSFADRRDLLFIGNFVHPPNADAMIYFANEIFPLIKRTLPELRLYIVGASPTPAVQRLAGGDIIVTGWVKDVAPFFRASRVFVAPLRYGAGLKGKIGQSLSYGLPVVTTSIGAEGLGLVEGRDVLIADPAEEFARKVTELYTNEALWKRLSENSIACIQQHYSPDVVEDVIRHVLAQLLSVQVAATGSLADA